jgi:nitroreductase
MSSFIELAKKRFSLRNFKPDPVEDEDLQYILEAGRIAPSAANYQPWEFLVISDKSKMEEVNALYHRDWYNNAPVKLILIADHSKSWHRSEDGKDHADIDIAIAADHMTLAAADKGLGTCWICNFDVRKTKEYFGLPDHLEPVVILPLGYPEVDADVERHAKQRKPLSEIVHYNEWVDKPK